MRYNDLNELVNKYDIITFDVFDTLLKRVFSTPEDLFRAVEEQFTDIDDFVKQRKKAEKKARQKCQFREVNIDEIYAFLEPVYGLKQTKKLKYIEIMTEINSALANLDILPIYEKCKKLGKTIFIISDMYLPGTIISKMLSHIGVTEYDKLYVSCDYRKTKWENGALFECVLSENHLNPLKVLHIGDNKRADIEMSKEKGINAYQVEKNIKKNRYDDNNDLQGKDKTSFRRLENYINATLPCEKSLAFCDGYEVFGPLLYQYIYWLKEYVRKYHIEKILFFARDGFVLQKAYNIIDPMMETEYFYASRRAVIVPLLSFANTLQDVLHIYRSWPDEIKVSSFLGRVGIAPSKVEKIIKKYGFSLDTRLKYNELLQNEKFVALYTELRPIISRLAKQQFYYFLQYFNESSKNKRISMVDIGGGCSIEIALRKVLEKAKVDVDLYGLYFLMNEKENSHRKAYLNNMLNSKLNYKLRFCYLFLEIFLAAPHGSVYGYKKIDDKIVPVFGKYDYDDENVQQDAIVIEQLQQGALTFFKNITKYHGYGLNFSQNVAFNAFFNFGIFPKKEDVLLWSSFHFNADEFDMLAHPQSIGYYIKQPKAFIKDLKESYWPAGFLCKILNNNKYNKFIFRIYQFLKERKG